MICNEIAQMKIALEENYELRFIVNSKNPFFTSMMSLSKFHEDFPVY